MPGIGIISNPKSRQNRKNPENMRRLAYILGTKGEAAETHSIDDLYRVAEEFKREKIDLLGINGGDGSLHVTLSAFFRVYQDEPFPKLAILRGGTLNTIATGLGIFGTPKDILYNLVEKYHSNEPFESKKVNTLSVDTHYGFIFGNGIVSNFMEVYYETGKPSPSVAARLLVRTIASILRRGHLAKRVLQRIKADVTVDGQPWDRKDFLTIAVATVPQIGLGFSPWYQTLQYRDTFQVLGIHCTPLQLGRELPKMYRGLPLRRDRVIDQLGKHLVIESETDIGYMIDGDHYTGSKRLDITLGPRLDIVIP